MNIFQEGFILKRKQKNKVFILIPAGVVLAGVIGGLIFWGTHHSGDDSVCQETVAKLETLQNADISATEQQIQELTQKDSGTSATDGSEDPTGGTVLSDVEIRQVFSGSVILGDSITESIVEYGYLDTDVVVSKRGLNVGAADEQIDTAIGLNPSHVFMAFGSNDLEIYGSNTSEFISAYRYRKYRMPFRMFRFTSTVSCPSQMTRLQLLRTLPIIRSITRVCRVSARKWAVPILTMLLL